MSSYNASDIEVLEGLEGVRKRPGMYIGGTDSRALHHLITEVLDNAMDEAVAGYADKIWLVLAADGSVSVRDNGRGIPVDPHPRFPTKSALEVVMTTLHSGGKFSDKVYSTAGGLHGVGLSVVNALSLWTEVEVIRDGRRSRQRFEIGLAASKLEDLGTARGSGTTLGFLPDPTIFPKTEFQRTRILEMCRSRAYLNRGVVIHVHLESLDEHHQFHFPNGLQDFIQEVADKAGRLVPESFVGQVENIGDDGKGRLEWAIAWTTELDTRLLSYCNTIPTPSGGAHELGLKAALSKGVREFAESRNLLPKGLAPTTDDVIGGMAAGLSVFVPNPQFSGQTKDRLTYPGLSRTVEGLIKDRLDHWLHGNPEQATKLVESVVFRAQERLKRKRSQTRVLRKTATNRLTLPGKLTDCISNDLGATELFIVEGDSAGGSAKQARDRHTQAILPLRGKILNVEHAKRERFEKNSEIQSLITAIGAGVGRQFDVEKRRYGRIIIMTDADVDGAHIASLLLTFFYRYMKPLLVERHLFMAQPPLFKINAGAESHYALDEGEKTRLLKRFESRKRKPPKITISRFKGLGEMSPMQLRETTMDPACRRLMRVVEDDADLTHGTFRRLMGKEPAERLRFIQEKAPFAQDALDI
ncbi:MAG: type IIA DNA topoisomerase subunit B [Magnetococcales bacterium]|nr:type IIA DNA topoisomerase subunit B [Magnetococcales bacterium]